MGDLTALNFNANAAHADMAGQVVGIQKEVDPGLCPGEWLGGPHGVVEDLAVQAYPAGTHTRALTLCVRLLTYFGPVL